MKIKWVVVLVSVLGFSFSVMAQDELIEDIQNADFEQPSIASGARVGDIPEKWFYFSSIEGENGIGISDEKKKGGLQSISFKALSKPEAYEGLAQSFKVTGGNHITFTAYVIGVPGGEIAGDAYGQVSIELKDASGKELQRIHGPVWGPKLSASYWEKYTVEADAPADASSGTAVITFYTKSTKGVGSFFVDEVEFSSRLPTP